MPGPNIKENWKNSLIKCTGSEYTKQTEKLYYINEEEKEKNKKIALLNALQFYKIMSYRSFYRRVLGEKIIDKKVIENNKIKVSYKKTDEGLYERDISIDRLLNLNNSLLIIEEAHNLTGNFYGDAVKKIIEKLEIQENNNQTLYATQQSGSMRAWMLIACLVIFLSFIHL